MVVRVAGAPTQAAPRNPYLQHVHLRVERQPHPCQLLVLILLRSGAVCHRRQRLAAMATLQAANGPDDDSRGI